ncbi:protein of unknown function [Burkholderia multivorans]
MFSFLASRIGGYPATALTQARFAYEKGHALRDQHSSFFAGVVASFCQAMTVSFIFFLLELRGGLSRSHEFAFVRVGRPPIRDACFLHNHWAVGRGESETIPVPNLRVNGFGAKGFRRGATQAHSALGPSSVTHGLPSEWSRRL